MVRSFFIFDLNQILTLGVRMSQIKSNFVNQICGWTGSVPTEQFDPHTQSAGVFILKEIISHRRFLFCHQSGKLQVFYFFSLIELNTACVPNWGFEEMEIYEKYIQVREKEAKELERKWKWCLAKLRKIAGIWWIGWEKMKKLHSPASSASFHSSVLLSLHLFCFSQWHSALN